MNDTTTSPLAAVNANTLDELFSRMDAQGLYSDADVTAIVLELRRRREVWKVEEATPKREAKSKKPLSQQELADLTKEILL